MGPACGPYVDGSPSEKVDRPSLSRGSVFGEIAVAGEASIFELLKIRHELVGGRSGSGFPQRKAVGIESGNGKSIVVVRSSVSLEISSN